MFYVVVLFLFYFFSFPEGVDEAGELLAKAELVFSFFFFAWCFLGNQGCRGCAALIDFGLQEACVHSDLSGDRAGRGGAGRQWGGGGASGL